MEAPDRAQKADRGCSVVDIDDGALHADQIPRARGIVDPNGIARAERRESGSGANGAEEMLTGVNAVGDGGQVVIEPAVSDRVEQRALAVEVALGWMPATAARAHRPE